MNNILAIASKELRGYFSSPIAYIVIGLFALAYGYFFYALTLFFDRQAKFLLALGVTEHPLFRSIEEAAPRTMDDGIALLQQREDAKRLVLPDGLGEEIRVLVQARGVPLEGWSFQRKLF